MAWPLARSSASAPCVSTATLCAVRTLGSSSRAPIAILARASTVRMRTASEAPSERPQHSSKETHSEAVSHSQYIVFSATTLSTSMSSKRRSAPASGKPRSIMAETQRMASDELPISLKRMAKSPRAIAALTPTRWLSAPSAASSSDTHDEAKSVSFVPKCAMCWRRETMDLSCTAESLCRRPMCNKARVAKAWPSSHEDASSDNVEKFPKIATCRNARALQESAHEIGRGGVDAVPINETAMWSASIPGSRNAIATLPPSRNPNTTRLPTAARHPKNGMRQMTRK